MKLTTIEPEERAALLSFGRRKMTPRAYILDRKPHLRTFLADALEELRFVISECGDVGELPTLLDAHQPDLVVLGSSIEGIEAAHVIDSLTDEGFSGHVQIATPSCPARSGSSGSSAGCCCCRSCRRRSPR
jgi:hypothetical protein